MLQEKLREEQEHQRQKQQPAAKAKEPNHLYPDLKQGLKVDLNQGSGDSSTKDSGPSVDDLLTLSPSNLSLQGQAQTILEPEVKIKPRAQTNIIAQPGNERTNTMDRSEGKNQKVQVENNTQMTNAQTKANSPNMKRQTRNRSKEQVDEKKADHFSYLGNLMSEQKGLQRKAPGSPASLNMNNSAPRYTRHQAKESKSKDDIVNHHSPEPKRNCSPAAKVSTRSQRSPRGSPRREKDCVRDGKSASMVNGTRGRQGREYHMDEVDGDVNNSNCGGESEHIERDGRDSEETEREISDSQEMEDGQQPSSSPVF